MADEAAVLLERAAAIAGSDLAGAGELALHAAALLEGKDRHEVLLAGAQLFAGTGDWARAAEVWSCAAEVAPEDGVRVRSLSAAGNAARRAGRWTDAEVAHRRAYELAVREFGDRALQVAVAAHGLAMMLKYTGGFAEAEGLYRRALEVAIAAGDEAFAAVICHNLGGLSHASGMAAEGVRWARRGLKLREGIAENPLALAGDEGALAALLIEIGEFQEAEALLLRSRATFGDYLGTEHHEVAVVNGNLALLALERGDLVAAEKYATDALAGKEAVLGSSHPELAPTLTTLGTIRRRAGDCSGAITLHQRALAVLVPQVEAGHPLLVTIRANLEVAAR